MKTPLSFIKSVRVPTHTLVIVALLASPLLGQGRSKLTYFPRDILTAAGNYVKYIYVDDSTYEIAWGNHDVKRTMKTWMDGVPDRFAEFIKENDSVIILQRSCGSPCWTNLILPLDSVKQPFEIEMPEAYDMKNNLVAYNGDQDTIVWVENFLTGHKAPVLGKPCGSACNCYCVQSISINDRELYIKWMTEYDFYKPKEEWHLSERHVHIDF